MSHFILTTMYEKSLHLIQDSHAVSQISDVWELSEKDSELVKTLLDNPPQANDDLKNLLALGHDVADLT